MAAKLKSSDLGKPFNGTARPATEEDIANLKRGDWVKLRDSPFCWQFVEWENEHFAIGEWEGDKFPLAKALLMVCTVVDGQPTRFRKSLPQTSKKRSLKKTTSPLPQASYPEIKTNNPELQECLDQFEKALDSLVEHPEKFSNNSDSDRWNPAHFEGEVSRAVEPNGQGTIFWDTSDEPPEPDDFDTLEEYEEAWQQWDISHPGIFSQGEQVTHRVQLPQDISPSGQSNQTPTPQPSTESDSLKPSLSSKTLLHSATNLLENSQELTSCWEAVLAKISPSLAIAPELKAIAQACFLSSSDSWKSNSLQCFFGKMSQMLFLVEGDKTSSESLKRLQRWGMWGLGRCETAIAKSPRTESESSFWVFTGDIRATTPKPGKKSLAEVIGEGNAIVFRAADGDRLYTEIAPTLRSLANTGGNHQGGTGAYKVREYEGETYLERPINATEAEQLMGWEIGSTATGINKEGDEIAISQTQRIKMLGNGIIPAEITDILTAIKPILERNLEDEVSENLRFAYRQLRQRGMSHQESVSLLNH